MRACKHIFLLCLLCDLLVFFFQACFEHVQFCAREKYSKTCEHVRTIWFVDPIPKKDLATIAKFLQINHDQKVCPNVAQSAHFVAPRAHIFTPRTHFFVPRTQETRPNVAPSAHFVARKSARARILSPRACICSPRKLPRARILSPRRRPERAFCRPGRAFLRSESP